MKTIPVSLIVTGFLAPVISYAQPAGGPQEPFRRGENERKGGQRMFMEAWKAADTDGDGFISGAEFGKMPRIEKLPEEKRMGLFKRLDKDQDGKLDHGELGRLGKPREGGEPMLRLWELDTDKSGGVSFEEFKAGRIFMKLAPEKQQAVFRRLDTNSDGVISPTDKPEPRFKGEGGGPRPKRPDAGKMDPRQIIRQLDQNGDGALSFEEFRAGAAVKDLSEDEQEDRFETLDKDQDLKITARDLQPPHGDAMRPQGPPPAVE